MRRFILISHTPPTNPDFNLNDLPGEGRIDVLCRAIRSAFLISHGIRDNVEMHIVVQDELSIRLLGDELKHLNPDERSTAALIRKSLEEKPNLVTGMEIESTPGIYISKKDIAQVLDETQGYMVCLDETGDPISEIDLVDNPVFILSDHQDLAENETKIIDEHVDAKASIGPVAVHGDDAITVTHNYLDKSDFTRF